MDFGRCRIIKSWPNWDNEIHTSEDQISRQARSMTYPFSFEIDKENKTGQFSSTTDIPHYDTTLSDCNCYDFQGRKLPCKHIYRLAVELGIIEIIKRPSFDRNLLFEVTNSEDIDNHPEQLKRQQSAKDVKCSPIEINREEKTATFSGSGKKPYVTTLDACTCRDFVIRNLPCKHMYRLAFELNGVQVEQGMNKNDYIKIVFSLEPSAQEVLYDLIEATKDIPHTFSICVRSEDHTSLLNAGLITERPITSEYLCTLEAASLKRFLSPFDMCVDVLSTRVQKQRLFLCAWVKENESAIVPLIQRHFIHFDFTDQLDSFKKILFTQFRKKFIRKEEPTEYYGDGMKLTLDYNNTRTVLLKFFSKE